MNFMAGYLIGKIHAKAVSSSGASSCDYEMLDEKLTALQKYKIKRKLRNAKNGITFIELRDTMKVRATLLYNYLSVLKQNGKIEKINKTYYWKRGN